MINSNTILFNDSLINLIKLNITGLKAVYNKKIDGNAQAFSISS